MKSPVTIVSCLSVKAVKFSTNLMYPELPRLLVDVVEVAVAKSMPSTKLWWGWEARFPCDDALASPLDCLSRLGLSDL